MLSFNRVFESLFPRICVACREPSSKFLCQKCQTKVVYLKGRGCQRCAHDYGNFLSPLRCPECENMNWHLDKVFALSVYERPIRDALLAFKQGNSQVSPLDFAGQLEEFIGSEQFDLLVPVPTTIIKRLVRGANPAERLTQSLAKKSEIPWERSLSRHPMSQRQQGKSEIERRQLSLKSFRCIKKVSGKKIALIDDVLTTGTTANTCAEILKNAGAKEVSAIVVARQMRK